MIVNQIYNEGARMSLVHKSGIYKYNIKTSQFTYLTFSWHASKSQSNARENKEAL